MGLLSFPDDFKIEFLFLMQNYQFHNHPIAPFDTLKNLINEDAHCPTPFHLAYLVF